MQKGDELWFDLKSGCWDSWWEFDENNHLIAK